MRMVVGCRSAVVACLASLVLAGCAEPARPSSAPVATASLEPDERPKLLAYDFNGVLTGTSTPPLLSGAATKSAKFEIPANASRIHVVNELDCAPAGRGQIDFLHKESATTVTTYDYLLLGTPNGACVTSGPFFGPAVAMPFPPVALRPGNYTVAYHILGSVRAHVEVVAYLGGEAAHASGSG